MGYKIVGGGNRMPEEYIPGPTQGSTKVSSYPNITATKDGRTVRINTVDMYADGTTMTSREARNAARIRSQKPGDKLITIPKPKPVKPAGSC